LEKKIKNVEILWEMVKNANGAGCGVE